MRAMSLPLALAILFPTLLVSTPAAAQEAAWKIDDPSGDIALAQAGPQPVAAPSTLATNHFDIRSVTIDQEDELGVDLTIQVEGMTVEPRPDDGQGYTVRCGVGGGSSGSAVGSQRLQFSIAFELEGSGFTYQAMVRVAGEASSHGFTAHSSMGLLCIQAPGNLGTMFQKLPTSLEKDRVHVSLTKAAIMGQEPQPRFPPSSPERVTPPVLKPGDKLSGVVVVAESSAMTDVCCLVGSEGPRDVAPNTGTGPDYTLQAHAANSVIRLALPGGSHYAVGPGNQSVDLMLVNRAEEKRLVRLDYEALGPDSGRIQLAGPAAVTVSAEQTRNFSLAIDVSGLDPLDPATRIRVRGESTGFPSEVALVSPHLVFGAPLGSSSNSLFLHASSRVRGYLSGGESCVVPVVGSCRQGFLSVLETDPSAITPDEIPINLSPTIDGGLLRGYAQTSTWMPASAPITFGAQQATLVELRFVAAQPVDLTVRARLSYSSNLERGFDDPEVGLGDATASGATGTTIRIQLPPAGSSATKVPAGVYFWLRIAVDVAIQPGGATTALGLRLVGAQSKIVMPLEQAREEAALQGTFQLRPDDDGQDFVNPGEARLVNVTLLNQAADTRTARLTLDMPDARWKTELLPGSTFTLDPGDSIRLGIRVHAPADAGEGERALVRLNATDEAGRLSSLRLALIATSGVDLPNDAGPYEPDADATAKLQEVPPKGSSASGVVGLLGVVALALARLRRRGKT